MSTRRVPANDVLRQVLEDTNDETTNDSGDSVSDQDSVSVAADSSSSNESESEPVVVPVVRGRGRGRGCGRVRGRGILAQNAVDDTAAIVTGDETSQEMQAKSGRLWSKVAPAVHRRGPQDIIRTPSAIRREPHVENEMNAFKLLCNSRNAGCDSTLDQQRG